MTAGYSGAHKALHRSRGPASAQVCIACGRPAEHWALQHDRVGDAVLLENGRPYSLRLSDYEPMCVLCHKRLDARTMCQRGRGPHAWVPENLVLRSGRLACRLCQNERGRRRSARLYAEDASEADRERLQRRRVMNREAQARYRDRKRNA